MISIDSIQNHHVWMHILVLVCLIRFGTASLDISVNVPCSQHTQVCRINENEYCEIGGAFGNGTCVKCVTQVRIEKKGVYQVRDGMIRCEKCAESCCGESCVGNSFVADHLITVLAAGVLLHNFCILFLSFQLGMGEAFLNSSFARKSFRSQSIPAIYSKRPLLPSLS